MASRPISATSRCMRGRVPPPDAIRGAVEFGVDVQVNIQWPALRSRASCGCERPVLVAAARSSRHNSLESSSGELFSAELLLLDMVTTQPSSDLRFRTTSRPMVKAGIEHCCCGGVSGLS